MGDWGGETKNCMGDWGRETKNCMGDWGGEAKTRRNKCYISKSTIPSY